ncbi:MAG: peptidoglycan-associated lipoprotein Pal [Alphaproteobacteria bacterium]|nr:peptidoglycan-associated lipoprotein Pal [Alphaproteobacteria bacterium]
MIRFSNAIKFAAVLSVVALAGCAEKPKPVPAAPPAPPPAAAAPVHTSSIVPGSAEDLRVNVGDTVHFAYNSSALNSDAKATLQRQAAWLQKYPAVTVQIQGNCDPRGTREYNLALGARRASAAKEFLVSLGVSPARLDTISYGKERPVCASSTESCWAKDRRDVTVITHGGATS